MNARTSNGITFQGGTSTGRGVRDYCEITDALPELFVTVGVGARQRAERRVRRHRAVADDVPQLGDLHDSEDRRARSAGSIQVDAEHAAVDDQHVRRDQRHVGGRQLQRHERHPPAVVTGTAAGDRPGVPDRRSDPARRGLRGSHQLGGHARREGPSRSAATGPNVGFDFYNLFNANTGTAFNQVYDVASNGAELAAADDGAQSRASRGSTSRSTSRTRVQARRSGAASAAPRRRPVVVGGFQPPSRRQPVVVGGFSRPRRQPVVVGGFSRPRVAAHTERVLAGALK